MDKNYKKQSGFILILAVLIIGTIVGTVSIFSNLIISGIRQSRVINNSVQAYYLAESASERSLHQVRRRYAIINCNDVDGGSGASCNINGFCSNDLTVPCVNSSKGTLDMQDDWEVTISNEMATSFILSEAGSFQIDLFSPIQNSSSNIDKVVVESSDSGLQLLAEFTNLTNILDIAQPNCKNQPPVFKDQIDPPATIDSLGGYSILEECSYSLKLNYPLIVGGNSTIITVTVFNDFDSQIPIPSRLIIDSQAKFGRSQQELRVRTPIRPPVSELYDFVVFSEEEISK